VKLWVEEKAGLLDSIRRFVRLGLPLGECPKSLFAKQLLHWNGPFRNWRGYFAVNRESALINSKLWLSAFNNGYPVRKFRCVAVFFDRLSLTQIIAD
jgi:hypothetical protein